MTTAHNEEVFDSHADDAEDIGVLQQYSENEQFNIFDFFCLSCPGEWRCQANMKKVKIGWRGIWTRIPCGLFTVLNYQY